MKMIRPLFFVALVPWLAAALCGAPPVPVENVTADMREDEFVELQDGRIVQVRDLPTLGDYFKNAKLVRK